MNKDVSATVRFDALKTVGLRAELQRQVRKASLGSDLNGINFSISHWLRGMKHAMTACC